jgi:hypothetical protein
MASMQGPRASSGSFSVTRAKPAKCLNAFSRGCILENLPVPLSMKAICPMVSRRIDQEPGSGVIEMASKRKQHVAFSTASSMAFAKHRENA